MGYRNHEGYSDPTAGAAMANVRRAEKAARKKAYRLAYQGNTTKKTTKKEAVRRDIPK